MARSTEEKMLIASNMDPEAMGMDGISADATAASSARRRMAAKAGIVATVLCGTALVYALAAAGGRLGMPVAPTSMHAVASGLSMKTSSQYGAANLDKAADSSLAPTEDMTDGSLCGTDEEDFGNACYKKCTVLTRGQYPVRCSAMSCAQTSDCSLLHTKISVGMCDGFDVSGDAEAKDACPHKHGVCLEDEELSGGMCFKTCKELSGGAYPYRKTAFTCCKANSFLACLSWTNTDTKAQYNCGGGAGDGNENTPRSPHPPLKSLAEAGASDVSTTPSAALAPSPPR